MDVDTVLLIVILIVTLSIWLRGFNWNYQRRIWRQKRQQRHMNRARRKRHKEKRR